jgi:hypothetical protein
MTGSILPPADREPKPLDEDWLKKVHARRVAARKKKPASRLANR